MPPCLEMWARAMSRYLLRNPVPINQGWKFSTSIRPVSAPSRYTTSKESMIILA